jgi:hypothetical protein
MSDEPVVEVSFLFRASEDAHARAFEERALGAGLHWDTFAFDKNGSSWRGVFRVGEGLFSVDGRELVEWLRSQKGVVDLEISGAAV